jgi:hypothetical protein
MLRDPSFVVDVRKTFVLVFDHLQFSDSQFSMLNFDKSQFKLDFIYEL